MSLIPSDKAPLLIPAFVSAQSSNQSQVFGGALTKEQNRNVNSTLNYQSIGNNSHNEKKNGTPSANTNTNTDTKVKHLTQIPLGQSSIASVYWNLLNALVGTGILAVPYVFMRVGIIGALLLLLLFAVICIYTLNLLIKCASTLQEYTYESLVDHCFSFYGHIYVCVCLFITDFGVMLNTLIVLGDASCAVTQSLWNFGNTLNERRFLIVIVSLVFIFPSCLFRDIAILEKLSFLKFLSILIIIAVTFYEWLVVIGLKPFTYVFINHNVDSNSVNNDIFLWDWNGFSFGLGIIAYTFVCHDSGLLYYNTLKMQTSTRWSMLSSSSIVSCAVVSVLIGIPGYFSFQSGTQSNILTNFHETSGDDPLVICLMLLYILSMAFSYPIAFFVTRHAFYSFVQKYKLSFLTSVIHKITDDGRTPMIREHDIIHDYMFNVHTAPLWQHLSTAVLLFFANLGLALVVTDLGLAMSLVGNIACLNLGFVLPCICYIKTVKHLTADNTNNPVHQGSWFMTCLYNIRMFGLPSVIAVTGVVLAVYGTVMNIAQSTSSV